MIPPPTAARILLVEDELDHAELMRRSFETEPGRPEVLVARTVAEAWTHLQQHTPDLMIVDWRLPDGEGIDLLERFAELPCPTVVMTGQGDEHTAVEAMKAGALDYVVKSEIAFSEMPRIATRALREWSLVQERKRLEEELQVSRRMEAIGQLAGGIAHDFNNLLTIIGAHAELITDGAPEDEEILDSAQEILKAHSSAASLTRQLLAFGGRQVLAPVVLDLNAAVRDVAGMLRRVIGDQYELDLELVDEECHVKADPAQLEQVVVNLVVNARDSMSGGGVITIGTERVLLDAPVSCIGGLLGPGGYVLLRVQDRGHGISPEVLARIFDPFFTTKPRESGTGLGLSSAFGIVRQSEGDLCVDTVVGGGTTFHVYLPEAGRAGARVGGEATTAGAELGGTETILFAEDDENIRALVIRVLSKQGYTIFAAEDGEEALELLGDCARPVDLLLTDVVMPRMSGHELAVRLRERMPELPTLFISGFADGELPIEQLDDRGVRFLAKPFTALTLCQAVRELLDAGRAPTHGGPARPEAGRLRAP